MYRRDTKTDIYEEIELFGMKMLLTTARIDRATSPEGVHLYELRHADEDWGNAMQIGKGILVNFHGTVLPTATPQVQEQIQKRQQEQER